MRTTIDIDDRLMRRAMKASGATTKREAVESGLRALIEIGDQTSFRRLRGKIRWDGDLTQSRSDKPLPKPHSHNLNR